MYILYDNTSPVFCCDAFKTLLLLLEGLYERLKLNTCGISLRMLQFPSGLKLFAGHLACANSLIQAKCCLLSYFKRIYTFLTSVALTPECSGLQTVTHKHRNQTRLLYFKCCPSSDFPSGEYFRVLPLGKFLAIGHSLIYVIS